ncbi:hypothetical protein VRB67_22475 [Pseudomonas trivialis]|uniref:hypothetical protein n=1 Tax=Pseudomonas trivialis TaxID=200450 RepID=UPI0030D45C8E
MAFRYKILAIAPDAYCSHGFQHTIENEIVFYSEKPPHTTYTKPNVTYEKYAYSYGMSLELPYSALPFIPKSGDKWEVNIKNIQTNDLSAFFTDSRVVNAERVVSSLYIFVSVPNMVLLGLGEIEITSAYTSVSTNTIYLLQERQVLLELL